ncbi:MAG: DUF3048 domain-containing protein [Actinomycetia bacterium]|nr:DUF3048 domain-containing protein [Actinomycetes bacterium]
MTKLYSSLLVCALTAISFATTPAETASAADPATDFNADVHAFGVPFYGDTAEIEPVKRITTMAATPDGGGYWLAASDGGIFAFGNAPFLGSLGDLTLREPIVGMAAHPSGNGYWLVASDGGVFAFGNAPFLGSLGDLILDKPIVGMAAHPSGDGYWLVASDGGVFAFGASRFLGSMGGIPLNKPVVGMAPSPEGDGYWLVASDGGIFAFNTPFLGSTGALTLDQPVVDMAATSSGGGYWMAAADGGLFAFGDAGFFGSAATQTRGEPVVGMEAAPDGSGYWMVRAAGPHWPLTGLPTDVVNPRPALAIKIDNHSGARGQWGLAQADVVFEEQVEGGLTRFIAVFHSNDANPVGPIRSARESDLQILPMFGDSLLAFSGGNSFVRSIVTDSPYVQGIWPDAEYGGAYYRTYRRSDPHNLLAQTSSFWSFAEPGRTLPNQIFEYREQVPVDPLGNDTTTISLDFGVQTASWHWEAGRYVRSHSAYAHLDADLARVDAGNVIVLETPYTNSPSTGSPVVNALGSGRGIAMIDGRNVEVTWSRPSLTEPFTLTRQDNGAAVLLTPGRTWVELVPAGNTPFV